MPELPEVETIRRQLEPHLVGQSISDAWGFDAPNFRDARLAQGHLVTDLRRRGKYLISSLSGDLELIVHLGMTGVLRAIPSASGPCGDHVRAHWTLSSGERLELNDPRRFGRVAVVATNSYEALPTLANLGPEPLSADFTAEHLWRALSAGRAMVKTKLLNQRAVAGVGNIYADEALWMAGIRPSARYVSRPRAANLRDAIVAVISDGIAHGGTTLRDYRRVDGSEGGHQHHLHCYGRAGSPCDTCGTVMRHTVIDGRGTTWCPRCQKP